MDRRQVSLIVLGAGFAVLMYNGGSRFTMGLMLRPMAEDLDWSRTALSLSVTLFMIVSALALPLSGRLVDRFDTFKVLGCALFLSGLSITLMSRIETPLDAIVLYGILFALASAGTSITPIGVVVSRVFPHRLGLANSIAISGMGIGQLLIILLLTHQVEQIGWRGAFVFLGILGMILLLPLTALALIPAARREAAAAPAPDERPGDPGVVWRSRYFWLLLALYAVCGFQDFFVATHVVAFARDQGMDTLLAGNIYAFMGLAGLGGVIAAGHLSDRYGPAAPTWICFALRIGIFSMVLFSGSFAVITGFTLIYGMTFWITAPLTVVFVRQRFGHRNLGTITGLVTMVHHGAGGLGALAGGALFDHFGNYEAMFQVMVALSAVALYLTQRVARHREPARQS